jgi:hypothetical protein
MIRNRALLKHAVRGWGASVMAILVLIALPYLLHTAGTDMFTHDWSIFRHAFEFKRINAFDYAYVAALAITVYWLGILFFAATTESKISKYLLIGSLIFFVVSAFDFLHPWLPTSQVCEPVEQAASFTLSKCRDTQTWLIYLSVASLILLIASLAARIRRAESGIS